MTFSYVGFDRSSEHFCLNTSYSFNNNDLQESESIIHSVYDLERQCPWREDGSAEVKCATYVSSWYLWYNLLSLYTKLPAPNFSQPSGFPIAIVVLMHGPAQNTAGWEIHTCLKDTKMRLVVKSLPKS
jgi:hypothetical protein